MTQFLIIYFLGFIPSWIILTLCVLVFQKISGEGYELELEYLFYGLMFTLFWPILIPIILSGIAVWFTCVHLEKRIETWLEEMQKGGEQ